MKNIILGAILSVSVGTSFAEPHPRQVRFMCGSLEEIEMTMEKYGEKMVLATRSPNQQTVNMLYANFETQTSSWLVHDLTSNDYCMLGVGDQIYIPDNSPLKEGTALGTKTSYK